MDYWLMMHLMRPEIERLIRDRFGSIPMRFVQVGSIFDFQFLNYEITIKVETFGYAVTFAYRGQLGHSTYYARDREEIYDIVEYILDHHVGVPPNAV